MFCTFDAVGADAAICEQSPKNLITCYSLIESKSARYTAFLSWISLKIYRLH